ncbi:MAG: phosphotransferase [Heliobacteriaceae bacterium]|nr:phosphotransferase [Heliobacteriaceae bacterium]MDD4587311.1 phosphotransferase [Heliobacteriaceae bacterium]
MRSTSGRLVSYNPRFSYPGTKTRHSPGRPPRRSGAANLRESADPPVMECLQGNSPVQVTPQLVPSDWQALTNLPASENSSIVSWQVAELDQATGVQANNEEQYNIEQVLAEFDCRARYIQRQKIGGDNPANPETVIRWQVETDQGPLVIKELAGPGAVEHATNIVDLLKHLHTNGFTHCPVPLTSKYGERVIGLKGQAYYVYPCLTGKPVRLTRTRDFRDAGQMLALFHQAGMGFQPVKKSLKTGGLPERYRSGQAAFTSWRQMVAGQRFFSDADELLREKLPGITERAGKVFQWLGPLYDRKYREAEEVRAVRYSGFSEKNLIGTNQGLYLDNLDWCCPDTPLMDVAIFVAGTTMASRDGWKHGIAFLEGYDRTHNLSTDCRHFVLGYLLLPHSLWQYVSGRLQHPSQEITVIPHRMLQNQEYKQAYRAVDLCRRLFFGARRLAVHAQIELPS